MTFKKSVDRYDLEQVSASGLFDANYYAKRYAPDVASEADLIKHFLEQQHDGNVDAGPLFSTSDYLKLNPDVSSSGLNPLLHYVRFGLPEGRPAFSVRKCNELFGKVEAAAGRLSEVLRRNRQIRVLYTEAGNFFFTDIAMYTAKFLQDLGWEAFARCDADPSAQYQSDALDLVVAPHEYMVIGEGQNWSDRRKRNAAYLNTEQWQTTWFSKAFDVLAQSRHGVLDLNATSVAAFEELGIRAAFIPLLPLAGTAFAQQPASVSRTLSRRKFVLPLTYPEAVAERPYDVIFVANLNERREKALAGLAPSLSHFRCFLHCPKLEGPVRRGNPDMLGGQDFTQLALNSKILLNIHRDDIGYFEWHRLFLYGLANGCTILTEPSFAPPFLVKGEHYLEAELQEMPNVLERLLNTPEGAADLARISENGLALARRIAGGERLVER